MAQHNAHETHYFELVQENLREKWVFVDPIERTKVGLWVNSRFNFRIYHHSWVQETYIMETAYSYTQIEFFARVLARNSYEELY